MATAWPRERKETECPMCHETFRQPKILPCAHVLCRDCLVTCLKTSNDAQCHLCHCAITDAKELKAKSCEEVADNLPTDVAMAAVVGKVKVLSLDHECLVCEGVTAVSVCLHCGDMLCQGCVVAHGKLSATSHHLLKDLANVTPENLATIYPKCSTHAGKPCELFCDTHNVHVCQVCASTDHRSCPGVIHPAKKIDDVRKTLLEFDAELSVIESTFLEAVRKTDRLLVQIDTKMDASLADVDSTCDRLQRSIGVCRKRLKNLVQESGNKVKAEVTDKRTKLLHKCGRVTSHRQLVKRMYAAVPGILNFDVTAKLKARISNLHSSTKEVNDKETAATMTTITIHSNGLSRLEREIKELGKVASTVIMSEQVTAKTAPSKGSLRFHTKHGTNIKLDETKRSAEKIRSDDSCNSLVMSSEAMKVNQLYEMHVDKTDTPGASIRLGVTWKNPDTIITLPKSPTELPLSIIVSQSSISKSGESTDNEYGIVLDTTDVGSRIGVMVDSAKCLHLYFDDVDQGVAARDIPQPCWVVFDLNSCTKISGLPE